MFNRLFVLGLVGFGCIAGSPRAQADLLETLNVPLHGSTANTAFITEVGQNYLVQVSGTFFIGGPGDGLADAEYYDFSNPPDSINDSTNGLDIGVAIDGVNPMWGDYAPDHVYDILFVGTGESIAVSYVDDFYSDNSGNLTFRLYSVPEPGTLMATTLFCIPLLLRQRRKLRPRLEASLLTGNNNVE